MISSIVSATAARRVLRSPLVDLLVGPHGIDRYLELIAPVLTVHDARAEVVEVRRQTARSVTLTLHPNAAWSGFHAGQFVRVGVEIDGVRHTRTYSPASSEHRSDGTLELTITVHPEGRVSRHLHSALGAGTVLHLGAAQGGFVLPKPRPQTLVLISGGSGVTPLLSMLRTLCDEGHAGEVVFVHYARTTADWLYRWEVEQVARRHRNVRVAYAATREGDGHVCADAIRGLLRTGVIERAHAAVCGPPALLDAVNAIWTGLPGGCERVLSETFSAPYLAVSGAAAQGTLRLLRSDRTVPIGDGTLLEQAEAAGLAPEFGCRMGICHTCTCRKAAGAVRNVVTGEISEEEDEDIQLCVSVPAGDVALHI
jgi:stearoyl-CoA 9-desaturase NADPH oxidoreductase